MDSATLNKACLITVIFLGIGLLVPNTSMFFFACLCFALGFFISFILMSSVIAYLYFSSKSPSVRLIYFKEGYKKGYNDKNDNKNYDDTVLDLFDKLK